MQQKECEEIAIQWPKNLGVCVKDRDGRVLQQNTYCKDTCGDQTDTICGKGCMLFRVVSSVSPSLHEGMQLHKQKMIEGINHDVMLFDDGEHIVSMLYPLEGKIIKDLNLLHGYGLSERELQVGSLILKSMTNAEIAKQLHIASSTLKTHINNIYRKLPIDMVQHLKQRSLRNHSSLRTSHPDKIHPGG